MILLFLTVLCFIAYTLFFGFSKTKTAFSISVLCITSILVILSFVVFLIKWKVNLSNVSLGAIFSLPTGVLLLHFQKTKKESLAKHGVIYVVGTIVFLVSALVIGVLFPEYTDVFNQTLLFSVILSCVGYGSYGYLNYIKREVEFKSNEVGVSYIVLLFSCAFFFSIMFFIRSKELFDGDYIFMIYSLCVVLIALFYESTTLYLKKDREKELEQELVSIQKMQLVLEEESLIVKEEPILVLTDEVVIESEEEEVKTEVELSESERHEIRNILYINLIENKLFLDTEITLVKFSNLVNIEKRKLQEYFKASESLTFKQYINRLKVEHAISIIHEREKDVTVEELTELCGFNNRLSFYRAFVNVYGFAPSELLGE